MTRLQEQWQEMLRRSFDPRQWFVDGERPDEGFSPEGSFMWIYRETESGLFTVGYFAPDRSWNTDSDWGSRDEAARRVNFLNGGGRETSSEVAQAAVRGYRGLLGDQP